MKSNSYKKDLITTKSAAQISGYTSRYLRRLAQAGEIEGVQSGRVWLVKRNSLNKFLDKQAKRKELLSEARSRARAAEYHAGKPVQEVQEKKVERAAVPVAAAKPARPTRAIPAFLQSESFPVALVSILFALFGAFGYSAPVSADVQAARSALTPVPFEEVIAITEQFVSDTLNASLTAGIDDTARTRRDAARLAQSPHFSFADIKASAGHAWDAVARMPAFVHSFNLGFGQFFIDAGHMVGSAAHRAPMVPERGLAFLADAASSLMERGREAVASVSMNGHAFIQFAQQAPGAAHDAYLAILGNAALAWEHQAFPGQKSVAAVLAAAAPGLNFFERTAVSTYFTLHGMFNSASLAFANLFGSSSIAVVPSSSPAVLPFTMSTIPAIEPYVAPEPPAPYVAAKPPSGSGGSGDVVPIWDVLRPTWDAPAPYAPSGDLASLRLDILATVAGMIEAVASPTAPTRIQRISDVRGGAIDGNFDGQTVVSVTGDFGTLSADTFTSGAATLGSVTLTGNTTLLNATSTNFFSTTASSTNLFAANANLGTLAVSGNATIGGTLTAGSLSVASVSSAGAISAPYFTATSTTATSTFAGGFSAASSFYTLQNGNVGIGTTTPGSKLVVDGEILTTNNNGIRSNDASGASRSILRLDSSDNLNLSNNSGADGGPIIFYSLAGGAESMRITADGNVGIGTTTPGALLDVGSGAAASTQFMRINGGANSGTGSYLVLARGSSAKAYFATSDVMVGDGSDDLVILTAGASQSQRFYTNGSERVRITASGNVGIGTTTPGSLLSVQGQIGAYSTSNGALVGAIAKSGTDSGLLQLNSGGTATVLIATNQSSYFNGGNVGIGTTSPTGKLVISSSNGPGYNTGDLVIQNPTAYSDGVARTSAISFKTNNPLSDQGRESVSLRAEMTPNTGVTSPQANLRFFLADNTNGLTEKVTFLAGGNVGIGTTTPSSPNSFAKTLDISGTSNASLVLSSINGVGTRWEIGSENTAGGLLGIFNGTTRVMSLAGSNVGIGTTTPGATLTVSGATPLIIDTTANNQVRFRANGAPTGQIYSTALLPFAVTDVTGALTRLAVDSSGNVGIGTTDPGAKLDIRDGKLILTDADVAHGMTDVLPTATYFGANVYSSTLGGAQVFGLTDAAGSIPLDFWGIDGGATTETAAIVLRGAKKSGTAHTTLADGEVILQINNQNNTKVTVLGSGNVGIGMTPTKTLDVTGTGRFSSTFTLANSTSCTGGQALQTNGSGDIACGSVNVSGASVGGGWSTNNIGSVTLATTTDSVGIGATSTPYAKLAILSGAVSTTTLALVPVSAQTANIIDIYNTSGALSSVFTAAGNLGIGTTSPANLVTGISTLTVSNGGGPAIRAGRSGSLGTVELGISGLLGLIDNAAAGGDLYLRTVATAGGNPVERLIVKADGNVGIGTTTPQTKLHVNVSAGTGGGLWVTEGSTQVADIGDGSGAGQEGIMRLYSSGAENVRLYAHSSNPSWINAGNVGIGTTSPVGKLTVQKNAAALTDTFYLVNESTAADSGNSINFADAGAGTRSASIGAAWATSGTTDGYLSFKTRQSNSLTEAIRINNSGNVGIGTTNPQQKFVVSDGGNTGLEIDPTGAVISGGISILAYDRIGAAYKDIGLGVSGTQMTLKSTGNVGIGTTTPATLLDVVGTTNGGLIAGTFQNWSTGSSAYTEVQFGNDTGKRKGVIEVFGSAYSSTAFQNDMWVGSVANDLHLGSGGSTRLTIDTAGSVGIGTTTPDALLTVNGTTRIMSKNVTVPISGTSLEMYYGANSFNGAPSAYLISFDRSNGVYKPIILDAASTTIMVGGAAAVTVTTSGNVGIGTTTPGATLTVSGATPLIIDTTANNQVRFRANGAPTGQLYSTALLPFAVTDVTGALTRLAVDSSGNVGIGTTTPSNKLMVVGNGTGGVSIGTNGCAGNYATIQLSGG